MISNITLKETISLIPEKKRESSKYDYGRLLAVCGSSYYRGAASLCCKAALRCGTGIVTLASTEKVISSAATFAPECTFLPLEETKNGTISIDNADLILENAKKCSALLIGCGLAIDDDTRSLVKNIVKKCECQLIIDADGLNILSECPDLIKKAKMPPVITPHHGEMARLCNTSRTNISSAPDRIALEFSKTYNCITVLKSNVTYVATYDGNIAINDKYGNSGLAKGGSGDVLAGIISAFCAQGMLPFAAAKCGVCIHGEAADSCAEHLSEYAMLPSDLITELCTVFLYK